MKISIKLENGKTIDSCEFVYSGYFSVTHSKDSLKVTGEQDYLLLEVHCAAGDKIKSFEVQL